MAVAKLPESSDKKVEMNYPGNSHIQKSEEPKPEKRVEKVVTGNVTQKKKSLGQKIVETFVGDDINSVGQYVFFEIIIPKAKDMIFDAFTGGLSRGMYGSVSRKEAVRPGGSTYTAYNKISSNKINENRGMSQQERATHDFSGIVFEDRADAEVVIERLGDLIKDYEVATVADFYDMAGISSKEFTDNKWGWTDIRDARVVRVREGYVFQLPKPRPVE